jgi:hypothetical protein
MRTSPSWHLIALGLLLMLAGCQDAMPAADVVGTYRAEAPAWQASLAVKADGTWEYRVERPVAYMRSGKWSTSRLKAWPAMLSFDDFDFGPLEKLAREQRAGLWVPKFSRTHFGEVQTLSGWSVRFGRI